MSDALTATRRIWLNPRNQTRTVPEQFGLAACVELAGRLLVILDGPRDSDDLSHKIEIRVEGAQGPLQGHLLDGQADRNGQVLVAEFGPTDSLGEVVQIALRIDDVEVLRVGALLSRTLP